MSSEEVLQIASYTTDLIKVEIEIQRNQTFSDSSENELNFNNTPL